LPEWLAFVRLILPAQRGDPMSLDGIHHFNPSYDFADMQERFDNLSNMAEPPPKAKRTPFALLPSEWIEALLDAKPPHAARSCLVTLRSLCQFALKQKMLRSDPTANIKLRPVKSDGHHCWTDDEIAHFEAHHAIGTKPRLALALLLYTGQRRGDVIRMGRQRIRNGALTVRQEKTGKPLVIPVHPNLQAVLDATPSEHLTFLSPRPERRTAAIISARAFASRAMLPDCRSVAARTDCARRSVAYSPRPDAAPTRSRASADM
jgi:integrase